MRRAQKGAVFQEAPFDRTGVTGGDRTLSHLQTLKAGLQCKLGLAFFQERIAKMGMAIDEVGMTIDQRLQRPDVLCRRKRAAVALLKRVIQFLDDLLITVAISENTAVIEDFKRENAVSPDLPADIRLL